MLRIHRSTVSVPGCLAVHDDPPRRYSDLHGSEKAEIRSALHSLQALRCAYCGRRTGAGPKDGHVEHFRRQADSPGLDRTWTNLFWSCNDEETCGKHKDKCDRPIGPQATYNPSDLLDPSTEDACAFLIFVADGTVAPREHLTAHEIRRAAETVRVFALGRSAYLAQSRRDAIAPYIDCITLLLESGPDLVPKYVEDTLVRVGGQPFEFAIRQILEGIVT
jgi:uncharacterized protein (TIGR02646 family)